MKDDNSKRQSPVILGHVSGAHGVAGWVKLHSHTDPRGAILDYRDCLMATADGWQPAKIRDGKVHGKGIIARFDGIEDRDTALACVGQELAVPRQSMPEPDAGHYYWADLQGLDVVHENGDVLGKVSHLLATGANDVLVVQQGDREILIPFVPGSVVLDVDIDGGTIRVDWEWD